MVDFLNSYHILYLTVVVFSNIIAGCQILKSQEKIVLIVVKRQLEPVISIVPIYVSLNISADPIFQSGRLEK